MKRLVFLLVLGVIVAGDASAAPECGATIVLQGCVGDNVIDPTCVSEYEATHTVTADDVDASPGNVARFCLVTVSSSLCPNTSAVATVTRNGGAAQATHLNGGRQIRLNAREGDTLRVVVEQVSRHNGVQCILQGDLQFELVR